MQKPEKPKTELRREEGGLSAGWIAVVLFAFVVLRLLQILN